MRSGIPIGIWHLAYWHISIWHIDILASDILAYRPNPNGILESCYFVNVHGFIATFSFLHIGILAYWHFDHFGKLVNWQIAKLAFLHST